MLFAALVVTFGPARPAAAVCDCTKLAVPAALTEATVVFTGELLSVEGAPPLTIMGFQVDGVYKGDVPTSFRVATFSNVDECGFGTAPPLGRWVVFAVQFPPENGVFYTSACGPTGLVAADQPLTPELGAARPPADAVPATTIPPPTTVAAVIDAPGDSDWKRPVLLAAAAMVALGLVSRVLAGRRRVVV